MQHAIKLLLFICFIITYSCATYEKQINSSLHQNNNSSSSKLTQRIYLIGDAGNHNDKNENYVLDALKKELSQAPTNSSLLFLGDNISPGGLPKKSDGNYNDALQKIQLQFNVTEDYKGTTFFIPGNHDWYANGIKGLKRQEKLVNKTLSKNSFIPSNGCAIEKVKLNDDVIIIAVDSQWYFENWNNHPTINDDCDIRTRNDFFKEFEAEIKKHRDKTILVAMHHPLISDGAHGGKFTAHEHLFPSKTLPLPILGSFVNFIRKTGGISPQDTQNKNYRYLVNRLSTIAQEAHKVIFVSGHEHHLALSKKNNLVQIISGSGSELSGAKISPNSHFAYGAHGYAILDIFEDGSSTIQFITTPNKDSAVVAHKENLFESNKKPLDSVFNTIFPDTVKASVYTPAETRKDAFYKSLWGNHYRKEYGTIIAAPTVSLDTLYGGLQPVRIGGGNQSVSLRLKDKNGKQWVMRALKKSAVQFLQINAFQETFIKEDLKGTYLETLLNDFYTAAHPYVSFVIPELAEAVGVNHTNPKLFYVPKQDALKGYNGTFGDALYMIEEHVGTSQKDAITSETPLEIISSLDLFRKLRKNPKHQIDEKEYIRARLFDMIIGDWDRHQDQWKWAKYKKGDNYIYKPIPRDRDQAFSNFDGPLLSILTRSIPALRKMQTYDPKIRSIKWHNTNGMPVDIFLLKSLTLEDWINEVTYIQDHLTDNRIDDAFKNFPKEVQNKNLKKIREALIYRRNNAKAIAIAYYNILQKCIILTATDKDDTIHIERKNHNETTVTFSAKNTPYFTATYNTKQTKELWIYALDGEDRIEVTGNAKKYIPIKLIGGQNNDVYTIKNGAKIHVYDYETKKNTIKEKDNAKVTLSDEYHTNTYDFTKRKSIINQITPLIGSNPDDGFFVGINERITFKNFRQNPFSHKHHLKASYFITNNGYDLAYDGAYGNILSPFFITFSSRYTSSNFATNFFGYGNETENFDKNLDLVYNRVKLAKFAAAIGVVKYGRQGSEFSAKTIFESIRVERTPNRFIGSFPNDATFFDRNNFAGGELFYQFENYNDVAFPTLGMNANITTGWKANLNDFNRSFGYLIPSFSFTTKLTNDERLVLANKTEAHITFGDQFEFYQAANIGGDNGLRGFRHQRFTGRNSFYNSTDLRFNFRKLKSGFAPMNLGFYGGLDLGRVWLKNDTSKQWHNSIGGGIWLNAAKFITGQAGAFTSSDGVRIAFKLGFDI